MLISLYDELRSIVAALNEQQIAYALCGGIAVAVHAEPRATKDIDLLVAAGEIDAARLVLRGLGYGLEAAPMRFASGVEVRRVSKVVEHELFTVDLVLATGPLEKVWRDREQVMWGSEPLWVVSRRGLVAMKRAAGRPQDLADLYHLGEEPDDGVE